MQSILFRHLTGIALLLIAALIVFPLAFGRDFGDFLLENMPVSDLVFGRLPMTLKLLPLWILFTAAISIPLGFLAATHHGTWIDRVAEGVAAFGVAAPCFCFGSASFIVLLALFGWFPRANQDGFPVGYILPAFPLGILSGAGMIRLMRFSLLKVPDGKDIKLARIRRCLRNTLIAAPVLFGGFLAGIVVIEPVFGLSGIGELGIVVAAWGGQVVLVLLTVADTRGCPRGPCMEVVSALAAFQQVLQQVEHLGIPLGLAAPLLLHLLRPFPGLIVDQLGDRDLNPGVPRLVVDLIRGRIVVVFSYHPIASAVGSRPPYEAVSVIAGSND